MNTQRPSCLLLLSALLLTSPTLMAAPDSCSHASSSVCPAWLPSQDEVGKTIKAYFWTLVKKDHLSLDVSPVVHTSISNISCAALSERIGSNFICGGTITFWDLWGRHHDIKFSPTLRRAESGNLAIYTYDQWVEPET